MKPKKRDYAKEGITQKRNRLVRRAIKEAGSYDLESVAQSLEDIAYGKMVCVMGRRSEDIYLDGAYKALDRLGIATIMDLNTEIYKIKKSLRS